MTKKTAATAKHMAKVDAVATKTTKPKAKKAPAKTGRPRQYDRAKVVARICELLATSEMGVARILKEEPGMPPMQKFWEWIDEKDKDGALSDEARSYRELYARAKQQQAEYMESLLIEIADESRNDYMEKRVKEGSVTVLNAEHIQRTRLRVDTRKWLMAKLHPKKYADSIKVGGDDELPPVKSESEVKVSHSFDDLRAALAKSLAKKPDA